MSCWQLPSGKDASTPPQLRIREALAALSMTIYTSDGKPGFIGLGWIRLTQWPRS
jgi:hypothetical protein